VCKQLAAIAMDAILRRIVGRLARRIRESPVHVMAIPAGSEEYPAQLCAAVAGFTGKPFKTIQFQQVLRSSNGQHRKN
jgi:hypothetical protein